LNLLDKNSRIGTATWLVGDILDRSNRTKGSSLTITSFISRVQIVKADMQGLEFFGAI